MNRVSKRATSWLRMARRSTHLSRPVLLAVLGATLVLGGLVLVAPPALRVPAAVFWMLVVPGLPWATRLGLADAGEIAAATLAISMAAAAIVGGGMAVLGTWSPTGAVAVLALVGAAGAVRTSPA